MKKNLKVNISSLLRAQSLEISYPSLKWSSLRQYTLELGHTLISVSPSRDTDAIGLGCSLGTKEPIKGPQVILLGSQAENHWMKGTCVVLFQSLQSKPAAGRTQGEMLRSPLGFNLIRFAHELFCL
jgi:hypothetical protein